MAAGRVEEIYISGTGGAPMERLKQVEAIEGKGLKGDRYAAGEGYWSGIDECQVTLIEGEVVDDIDAGTDVRIAHGEHRRNIITRGVSLRELSGRRFSVGEVVLEFDRPRPPCRYIETLTQSGMMAALSGWRGGICARVVKGGVIAEGDVVEVV